MGRPFRAYKLWSSQPRSSAIWLSIATSAGRPTQRGMRRATATRIGSSTQRRFEPPSTRHTEFRLVKMPDLQFVRLAVGVSLMSCTLACLALLPDNDCVHLADWQACRSPVLDGLSTKFALF